MSDNASPVTGGCLCEAIRYESSEEPYAVAYCHCNACKKALGSVLGVAAFFRGGAFRFTKGKPKVRQSSEVAERAFCGECGTPIYMRYLHDKDLGVSVGSLDHPEKWPPNLYHYCSDSMVPWLKIDDGLRRKPFDAVNHQKIVDIVRSGKLQPGPV